MQPSARCKGLYGFPKQLYHYRTTVSQSSSGKRNQINWTHIIMTALMILGVGLLRAEAGVTEERVTLSLKNAPLQKVFGELKKQTGYHFVYRDEVLRRAHKVDVQVTKGMLKDVLLMVFRNQFLFTP